ncbi:hypothetical protein C5167_048045 [Papaver somniferum]|uniref:Uncharacterized protein n=1 Tax=Papaver somniferum TaxID=3469 RepID=A0A4Y7KK43_PAPSO|nr:hypothetical protein C5167_048045 [Papaver somniferum]
MAADPNGLVPTRQSCTSLLKIAKDFNFNKYTSKTSSGAIFFLPCKLFRFNLKQSIYLQIQIVEQLRFAATIDNGRKVSSTREFPKDCGRCAARLNTEKVLETLVLEHSKSLDQIELNYLLEEAVQLFENIRLVGYVQKGIVRSTTARRYSQTSSEESGNCVAHKEQFRI